MKTRTLGILLFALVVSLPLAIAVLAHSEQPALTSAPTTQLASVSSETAVSSECAETGIQGECVPATCQINCPLDSCSAGPCDEGWFAKCVCRSGGHAMCGCVPCP
jgi:hypothetical protein